MIQKLKNKIIFILTAIFWTILIGILLAINLSNYQSNQSETNKILSTQEKILKMDNVKNIKPDDDEQKISWIYSVNLDKNMNYSVIFFNDNGEYSKEEIISIAKGILDEKKNEGSANHFRYKIVTNDDGVLISFMDNYIWEQQQYRMMIYSVLIGLIGMVILFIVAILLAGWLIRPINSTFNRQKQFISDAGHELKTPLTVMKASLDMLESEFGKNKYWGYIRDENSRMTVLIHELLTLSNLEKLNGKINFEKLNLSRILEGTCLPFECLAFEKEINLELQIQNEIYVLGNEKQLIQMIEVLIDNAVKHTYEHKAIIISLCKDNGKVLLQVKNQGDFIPEKERNKIFDRFYRVDKSRKRTEGRYGLGLAIANSIAEDHKSKISVDCKDNWTIFSVKFN